MLHLVIIKLCMQCAKCTLFFYQFLMLSIAVRRAGFSPVDLWRSLLRVWKSEWKSDTFRGTIVALPNRRTYITIMRSEPGKHHQSSPCALAAFPFSIKPNATVKFQIRLDPKSKINSYKLTHSRYRANQLCNR